MPFTTYEQVNIGIGLIALLGSGYFGVRKAIQRQKIVELENLYNEGMKTNLNQITITKQKEQSKNFEKYLINRPVAVQKVRAHFMDGNYPNVEFISGRYDDFAKIQCSPFQIVQKTLNKSSYEMYTVNAREALVSQNIIIPDLEFQDQNKSSQQFRSRIFTSASTLGIIGTLSLSSDSSSYFIDAKIIGVDLKQIQKYISDEKLYNMFGLIVSGVGVILSIGWIVKTYREINRSRVPFQASLLQTSNIRR